MLAKLVVARSASPFLRSKPQQPRLGEITATVRARVAVAIGFEAKDR